ncbi:hypothetical protein M9458_030535, partial [Cirrhinus mrigala]
SGAPQKADNENGIMEKATTIMDCNRSEHPVQDCESSRPNHTLAPHCNSLTGMVTQRETHEYV